MGRGRAKAKQTKVARQLKYSTGGFDPTRLADELGVPDANGRGAGDQRVDPGVEDDEREDDPYAKYADLYSDDDEDDEDEAGDNRHRT